MRYRRRHLLRKLVLGLAVAAIAVPTAQARVEESFDGWQQALGVQTAGHDQIVRDLPSEYPIGGSDVLVRDLPSEYPIGGSDVLVAVRPDDRAERFSPTTSVEPVAVTVKPDGFDWGDAGIGAAMAFAAMLLAAAATLGTRRLGRPSAA